MNEIANPRFRQVNGLFHASGETERLSDMRSNPYLGCVSTGHRWGKILEINHVKKALLILSSDFRGVSPWSLGFVALGLW